MKLYRPHIADSLKLKVAERQLLMCNIPPWPANIKVKERLFLSLRELFGTEPCQCDHDPALVNREFDEDTGKYTPDANDPDYLVWRTKSEHDIKTRVRGDHGQHSDFALARKRKRKERKARRLKRKWPSRSFRG